MGTKTIETVVISKEMLAKIDSLRDTERTPPKQFSIEQDAIMLKYYEKKNKKDLAELLGVCQSTMRKRYKELTDDKTKQ